MLASVIRMAYVLGTMTDREEAVSMARAMFDSHGRRVACEAALAAFPSVKMSPDQLAGLAFGVTWYGFGRKCGESR
jgi:hypothetical protein